MRTRLQVTSIACAAAASFASAAAAQTLAGADLVAALQRGGHVIVMEMPFRGVDTAADSTAGMARSRSRRLSKKARLEATSGYLTVESVIEAVRTLFA